MPARRSPASPPTFAYLQVASELRRQIADGTWMPGQQLPPLATLVRQYGFSRVTVFKAMELLESQGVITMGRGKGTFVRRHPARPAVGLVTRHLLDAPYSGFPAAIASALEHRLHAQGWTLRLYTDSREGGRGNASWELVEALERQALQGLLTVNSDLPVGFMKTPEWSRLAIPHVDLSIHRGPHHRLVNDLTDGVRRLSAFCHERGLRSLGVLGHGHRDLAARLSADGLQVYEEWSASVPTGQKYERGGFELIRQLLTQRRRPQVLFINDDVLAKGVVQGLLGQAVRVPDELMLVAQTNRPVESFFPLPIVELALDLDEVARIMLELLTSVISKPAQPLCTRYYPYHLDLRGLEAAPQAG